MHNFACAQLVRGLRENTISFLTCLQGEHIPEGNPRANLARFLHLVCVLRAFNLAA